MPTRALVSAQLIPDKQSCSGRNRANAKSQYLPLTRGKQEGQRSTLPREISRFAKRVVPLRRLAIFRR